MKHLRTKYNVIQDPSGRVAEDEPVFLLRAKDVLAPSTVRFWANLLIMHGGDSVMAAKVTEWAYRMERWQEQNGMSLPDLDDGEITAIDVKPEEKPKIRLHVNVDEMHIARITQFLRSIDGTDESYTVPEWSDDKEPHPSESIVNDYSYVDCDDEMNEADQVAGPSMSSFDNDNVIVSMSIILPRDSAPETMQMLKEAMSQIGEGAKNRSQFTGDDNGEHLVVPVTVGIADRIRGNKFRDSRRNVAPDNNATNVYVTQEQIDRLNAYIGASNWEKGIR